MNNSASIDQQKMNLLKWVYPILATFGIIGNTASLKLIARTCKQSVWLQKFSVFFKTQALTDLIVVLFGCLREYFEDYHLIQIRSSSLFACKFTFFVYYLSGCFSTYLNVIITAMSATEPFSARTSRFVITILFFACVCVNMPFLLYTSLNENINMVNECQLNETPYELEIVFIDNIISSLVPLLIATIFFTVSLVRFIASNINKKGLAECKCLLNDSNGSCTCVKKPKPNDNRNKSIVITTSFSYVLFLMPINYFIFYGWYKKLIDSTEFFSHFNLIYFIGKMLIFLKCSTNILFFILLRACNKNDDASKKNQTEEVVQLSQFN